MHNHTFARLNSIIVCRVGELGLAEDGPCFGPDPVVIRAVGRHGPLVWPNAAAGDTSATARPLEDLPWRAAMRVVGHCAGPLVGVPRHCRTEGVVEHRIHNASWLSVARAGIPSRSPNSIRNDRFRQALGNPMAPLGDYSDIALTKYARTTAGLRQGIDPPKESRLRTIRGDSITFTSHWNRAHGAPISNVSTDGRP